MTDRPYLCREWLVEDARNAVLVALDQFAVESGLLQHSSGWNDSDLPTLFKAIDAHVDRLIERSGLLVPDRPYSAEDVERTRQELEAARAATSRP